LATGVPGVGVVEGSRGKAVVGAEAKEMEEEAVRGGVDDTVLVLIFGIV
jgi:hypothetical protein